MQSEGLFCHFFKGDIKLGMGHKTAPFLEFKSAKAKDFIYVVDSSDSERIKEAAETLRMQLEEDELRDAPVLVFANKQDLPRAMSVNDITEALSLSGVRQPWFVQSSSAVSGAGLALQPDLEEVPAEML